MKKLLILLPLLMLRIFLSAQNVTLTGPPSLKLYAGSSNPSNVLHANVGELYLQSNSGIGYLWQKTAGSGMNNGWTQLINTSTVPTVDSTKFWRTTGNTGTDPATNFIGTADNQDLIFKRNDTLYGYFKATNLALGYQAGEYHGAGDYNIFFGYQAGQYDGGPPVPANNIGIGYQSLLINQGSFNVAIGANTLTANTTADNCIGIGNTALGQNTTGVKNVGVGSGALGNNITGDHLTAIGFEANVNDGLTNSTAIGAFAFIGQSNSVSIGDTTHPLQVGIGTAYPQARLDVEGTVKITDGTEGAGKVLTSDASGNASWQYKSGTSQVDSSGTAGTKFALAVGGTYIIKSTGTITADTLVFPSLAGLDNQNVDVIFHNAVTSIIYSGTGTANLTPTATVSAGTYRRYIWKNGAWQ